jgi:hypothetical protein
VGRGERWSGGRLHAVGAVRINDEAVDIKNRPFALKPGDVIGTNAWRYGLRFCVSARTF